MRTIDSQHARMRMEIVTTTFVASGAPDGIRDAGRLLETLNNQALSHQLLLRRASLRPLYRAAGQLDLDADLLVRRDDIIFANFEGPYDAAAMRASMSDTPVLVMAPPFQIQGIVGLPAQADVPAALRSLSSIFFIVRAARVYDADGVLLGEGDQIVVNGGAMQMISATSRHIAAGATPATPASDTRETRDAEAPAAAAAAGARSRAA
jgi:hypothetical protein